MAAKSRTNRLCLFQSLEESPVNQKSHFLQIPLGGSWAALLWMGFRVQGFGLGFRVQSQAARTSDEGGASSKNTHLSLILKLNPFILWVEGCLLFIEALRFKFRAYPKTLQNTERSQRLSTCSTLSPSNVKLKPLILKPTINPGKPHTYSLVKPKIPKP